jgi:hypothetical protein
MLHAAPLPFNQGVAHLPCTGHTERVSNSDTAAVHVDDFFIEAEGIDVEERDRCEGLSCPPS